ncbi:hypothetical protein WA026_009895 [Henosepilachna vigintioctopunctata]|uniref:Insulin-like domain-containing protein n=1 Tax=Henosepilachna vigintioctopunctata TaxID=420089 RepID=A0AAW1TR79_9CUCU
MIVKKWDIKKCEMNISRLFFYLIIMFVSLCKCQMDSSEQRKKKYCGPNLSQTLSTVCRGNYNTLTRKTDAIEKLGYRNENYDSDKEAAIYPLIRRSRAVSMRTNHARSKRGVFNECCQKACSQRELSYYCGH